MNNAANFDMNMKYQQGAALITALIILLVLTVLGISAMRNTSLQENITGNLRDHDLALQAAETALTDAEGNLSLASATNIPIAGGNLIVSGTTLGPIIQRDTLPPMNTTGHDYTVWDGTNDIAASSTLQGLAANPTYIIEFEQAVIDNLDPESRAKGRGRYYYRVTARGVGSSKNSVVLLQEHYAMRRY